MSGSVPAPGPDRPESERSPRGPGRGDAQPADPTPPPKVSRAGRNLPAAIGVGVGLGALLLMSLLVVRGAFLGVVVLAAVVGIWELSTALATASIRIPRMPLAVGGTAMLVAAWLGGAEALVGHLGFAVLLVLVWRMIDGAQGFVRDVTAAVFVLAYVPLLGSFVVLMLVPADGAMRIVAFLLGVFASDTGGYIAGVLAGRHPMAPTISPKKSWEGFAGSVAGSCLAGWLTVTYALDGDAWVGVLLGVATAVTATVGDLVESLIKRDLGIKDMGRLLPGHGGLMDRLDSILMVAPVAWFVLSVLVPVS
ncbi:MAG: phosphatidate cytidylyltransferase [Nocardioidaceae bacterium]|jgi:phosphatidate cytidylyltransferase|nr:phosphatidate cytidylyltransferase [Nocardioidaceae bacterium]